MNKIATSRYKFNATPRMSANQIAEYCLASPTRRQAILKNAKYPPALVVNRYSVLRRIIVEYLSNDDRPASLLEDARIRFLRDAEAASSNYLKDQATSCLEALSAFRTLAGSSFIRETRFREVEAVRTPLMIHGVDVSVKLDALTSVADASAVGGAILQISKTLSSQLWREDHGKTVASLVHSYLTANAPQGTIDHRLCLAIDVFGQSVVRAPGGFKRRQKDIEAACREIGALWTRVPTPPGFEGWDDGAATGDA
ncbi:hypothetical protein [uncultured Rhodospira sp.]|uniref:hypothetical protein n=1 Tax=uncultured Rhodospira sp. TaxID=1936189 RepID=UPI0026274FBE|nr:hypothetical protein [uncultured Rhodospira sp.]